MNNRQDLTISFDVDAMRDSSEFLREELDDRFLSIVDDLATRVFSGELSTRDALRHAFAAGFQCRADADAQLFGVAVDAFWQSELFSFLDGAGHEC